MSFKTMDGVEVYDKRDIDLIKDSIDTTTSQHSTDINQLKNKANSLENSAEQTRQAVNNNHNAITELENRVTATENDKLNASDLPQAVSDAVDIIINSKLALIESDINHIVDNAIDDELEDYDNKAAVDQKITTAIATAIDTRPTAMSTAEATVIVDRYF